MQIKNEVLFQIYKDRYQKNNESIDETLWRVATYCANNDDETEEFYELMNNGLFFPAGRTMSNAGIGKNLTLNNCFLGGHKVLTDNGFKNIEDVKIGDKVLTHENVFKEVNNIMSRDYEGDIYEITPLYSMGAIKCTPNHKFLTDNRGWVEAKNLNIKSKKDIKNWNKTSDFLKLINNPSESEKINIIDILDYVDDKSNVIYDNDYIWTETNFDNPKNKEKTAKRISKKIKRFIELDSEMAYLIGRWIGDGFTSYANNKANTVFGIVFNKKEYKSKDKLKNIIKTKFGIDIKEYINDNQNTIILRTTNMFMGNLFVNLCGLHNEEKKLPNMMIQNNNIGLNLLLGLLDSDGYVKLQGNVSITLKNKKLLEQIQDLSFKLNLYCNLKDRKSSYIYDNGAKAMAYELNYNIHSSNKIKEKLNKVYEDTRLLPKLYSTKTFRIKDNDFYTRIKDIKINKNQKVKVYNLSVLDVHSYSVEGVVVHNCFTLNFIEDSIDDIFNKVKMGAKTHQSGGGTGYEFSQIRPNGFPTSNEAIASGVVSFMHVFNAQTATISQGGRRGANMGGLSIYHPDIFEFINAKSYDKGILTHFNLSIVVDNDFMNAVENNEDIFLHYPVYDNNGFLIKDETKWQFKKKVSAIELWNMIIRKAYDNGEPGILFYDNMNLDNNTWYIENIINTNPCAEYLSGVLFQEQLEKYLNNENANTSDFKGACNLGSIYIHNFIEHPFTQKAHINFDKLKIAVCNGVKFLDNIIDINKFPLQEYENYQKNLRTIGLGITGLADAFAMLNLKYGSKESIVLTDKIMNFIVKNAYKASIELAKIKGCFPLLDKEKFVRSGFIQKHTKLDDEWLTIVSDILVYGIRNARLISVAPTGTMSLTFGNNCSSGCEPIFAVEYDRKVKIGGQGEDNTKIVKMKDYAYDLWERTNSNDNIVPKDVFVTTNNLTVDDHLNVLRTIAFHVDMSCSKTINLPTEYSFEDTKKVYYNAWKSGIKGCTIFRPNEIRQGILINTEKMADSNVEEINKKQELTRGEIYQVSNNLIGKKEKLITGCGSLHLQAWFDPKNGDMMEVFLLKGSDGGCLSYMNGLSRMISLSLRGGISVEAIADQLKSTMSCSSYAVRTATKKDTSKGNCCPTAIANVLVKLQEEVKKELENNFNTKEEKKDMTIEGEVIFNKEELSYKEKHGEIAFAMKYNKCPNCSEHIKHVEGCLSCLNCGWTKC